MEAVQVVVGLLSGFYLEKLRDGPPDLWLRLGNRRVRVRDPALMRRAVSLLLQEVVALVVERSGELELRALYPVVSGEGAALGMVSEGGQRLGWDWLA